MRIDPVIGDSLKAAPHSKEKATFAPQEESSQPLAGDSVHLSKLNPETKKPTSSSSADKKASPTPAKDGTQKPEPQAIPTCIFAEFNDTPNKTEAPAKKTTLNLNTIRKNEKPFLDLSNLPAQERKIKKGEFYNGIFSDADLQKRTEKLVKQWAIGESGIDIARESFSNVVLEGKPPSNETEKTIFDMITTRKERWGRLAEKLGIQPPTSFHLYRGVKGDYAVSAIAKAWSDNSSKYMNVPNLELTSWSLDLETAKDFASGSKTKTSVVYEADIPFTRTLMDKWLDDNSFITKYYKEEEVVVAGTKDSIRIPKDQATVKYKDKIYTYDNRQEFIKKWNKDHSGLLYNISQTISKKFHDFIGY
jgi:hypothetical protein